MQTGALQDALSSAVDAAASCEAQHPISFIARCLRVQARRQDSFQPYLSRLRVDVA